LEINALPILEREPEDTSFEPERAASK